MIDLNYKELFRQGIHFFFGIIFVLTPESWDLLVTGSVIIIAAITAYVIGIAIEEGLKGSAWVAKLAAEKAMKLINIAERQNVLLFKGAMLFFVGVGTTMIVFHQYRDIALLSILCLAVGDSLSTAVGIHVGNHKIPRNKKKSWEGSLAGFAGILIIGGFFFRPQTVLIAALVSMFIEAYVRKIDDNFAIPLITGAVLYIVQTTLII